MRALRESWHLHLMAHHSSWDLDAFSRCRLAFVRAARIEQHLHRCGSCLRALVAMEAAVGRAQPISAAKTIKPMFSVHRTVDGPIYLRARRSGSVWEVRVWSSTLDRGSKFALLSEAHDNLHRWFTGMYPEHRCNSHCRSSLVVPVPQPQDVAV